MIKWFCLSIVLVLTAAASASNYQATDLKPDFPQREFRGAWIATVHNIDWPSRENLPADVQKAELVQILDRAVALNLNAIILQVRSECDAMYPSAIEPWAPWLTGTMGKSPGYDPLQFAIDECHTRGLELHAWFNPFRAVNSEHGLQCEDHVTATHKDALRTYGKKVWLDPSLEFSRTRAMEVIKDVLVRYDIDGIHIDDYFYPYPVKNRLGLWQNFDDSESYKAYKKDGGDMNRDDWRRDHVNRFVRDLYADIKSIDPSCKFGISPFGIWRPGYPHQVKKSLDCYNAIYADTRLWWNEGWLDYLAPQLYWKTDHKELGFKGLFSWWRDENKKGRHLWPGIATNRIKSDTEPDRPASESVRQIQIARSENHLPSGTGHIHFSFKTLMEDRANINETLLKGSYTDFALVPESPWLSRKAVPSPEIVQAQGGIGNVALKWAHDPFMHDVRWWLLQRYEEGQWKTDRLLKGNITEFTMDGAPEKIALTPIGLAGELGKTAGLTKMVDIAAFDSGNAKHKHMP